MVCMFVGRFRVVWLCASLRALFISCWCVCWCIDRYGTVLVFVYVCCVLVLLHGSDSYVFVRASET